MVPESDVLTSEVDDSSMSADALGRRDGGRFAGRAMPAVAASTSGVPALTTGAAVVAFRSAAVAFGAAVVAFGADLFFVAAAAGLSTVREEASAAGPEALISSWALPIDGFALGALGWAFEGVALRCEAVGGVLFRGAERVRWIVLFGRVGRDATPPVFAWPAVSDECTAPESKARLVSVDWDAGAACSGLSGLHWTAGAGSTSDAPLLVLLRLTTRRRRERPSVRGGASGSRRTVLRFRGVCSATFVDSIAAAIGSTSLRTTTLRLRPRRRPASEPAPFFGGPPPAPWSEWGRSVGSWSP